MPDEIPVSDSFQPAPGVDYGDNPPAGGTEPAKVEQPASEPAKAPEAPAPAQSPTATEPAKEPEKSAEPAQTPAEPKPQEQPRDEAGKFVPRPAKAKPIANLLAKNHEYQTQIADRDKTIADLQSQIQQLSKQSPNAATDADITAFAEEIGADPAAIQKLVDFARRGMTPQLPKEVQELIQQHQMSKQEQAELAGFEDDYNRLSKSLPDEQVKDPKVKDKLLELAYSDAKAPDGEPYFKKSLVELYYGFIKPEMEPAKPSAETSQAGRKGGSQVLDFQEIFDRDDPKDIDAMDSATFQKYQTWRNEKQGRSPIQRRA